MDEQAQSSIVRIYKRQDDKAWPIGCGFLAGGRSVLTCWHVVRDALAPEKDLLGKEVELDFPFPTVSAPLEAKVVLVSEQPDLAKLELPSDPPGKTTPMPLSTDNNLWGHPYHAFGITANNRGGFWNIGEIISVVGDRTIQLEGKSEHKIEKGFSGTAIWDDRVKKAVGMVALKESDKEIKVAYAIPMVDIFDKCPELKDLNLRSELSFDKARGLGTAGSTPANSLVQREHEPEDNKEEYPEIRPEDVDKRILEKAAYNGKYSNPLNILCIEEDRNDYTDQYDYGEWEGKYKGYRYMKGFWVYVRPYWIVWEKKHRDPDLAAAWNNKGLILYNQGKYDEAIQAYDKAIKLDPKDADPWNNKAIVFKALGRIAEADAAYAAAVKVLSETFFITKENV